MASPFTAGWLPVTIGFDANPALLPDAPVRWVDFGSTALSAPYFDLDVDRLRAADPPAREAETGIDAIVSAAAGLPPVRPAGFIFDLAHCGATLVANVLQTAERAV